LKKSTFTFQILQLMGYLKYIKITKNKKAQVLGKLAPFHTLGMYINRTKEDVLTIYTLHFLFSFFIF
jgi:hypothetical protein